MRAREAGWMGQSPSEMEWCNTVYTHMSNLCNRDLHPRLGKQLKPIKPTEAETKEQPFWRRHFQTHFLNEYFNMLMQISLKVVPKGSVNNMPSFIEQWFETDQVTSHYLNQGWLGSMAHTCVTWHRWIQTLTHKCISKMGHHLSG